MLNFVYLSVGFVYCVSCWFSMYHSINTAVKGRDFLLRDTCIVLLAPVIVSALFGMFWGYGWALRNLFL